MSPGLFGRMSDVDRWTAVKLADSFSAADGFCGVDDDLRGSSKSSSSWSTKMVSERFAEVLALPIGLLVLTIGRLENRLISRRPLFISILEVAA